MTHTVLLTGATGYIGARLLRHLQEQGHRVRCLTRKPEYLTPRLHAQAEVVAGDALDYQSVATALTGIECAYYLVHSMGSADSFEDLDRKAAENFARASREKGVRRIVYLGGLGDSSTELSPHLRSRQRVGEILASSGLPVVEPLKPSPPPSDTGSGNPFLHFPGGRMTNIIEQIYKAIGAHGAWKVKLRQNIDGTLALVPADVGMDNRCEFGKWLYSPTGTPAASDPYYKEILELHKAFHKVAATVVTKVQSGDKPGAEASIGLKGDYTAASSELTAKMMEWKKTAAKAA